MVKFCRWMSAHSPFLSSLRIAHVHPTAKYNIECYAAAKDMSTQWGLACTNRRLDGSENACIHTEEFIQHTNSSSIANSGVLFQSILNLM